MEIKQMLLTPNKYSRPQTKLSKVTKIAVHYVGNAGSSALSNRNYFENLKNGSGIYASSHYIIGLEGEIIQCIPENEVAYCTNQANSYSISIENCHPKVDGKFTNATRKSLVDLCVELCRKYKLNPLTDIIRHYDVTGKYCPLYWVNNPDDFTKFKNEVNSKLNNLGTEVDTIINIAINSKIQEYKAKNYNGNNYVEGRKFLETLGYVVGFNNDKKRVTVDNKLILDVPTIIENGVSFIHLRETIDFLNKYDTFHFIQDKIVTYNEHTKLIVIS